MKLTVLYEFFFYLQSLGILGSAPAALLILSLFGLLLYLLTRCCDRKPRTQHSITSLKVTLSVVTVLCCAAIGLGKWFTLYFFYFLTPLFFPSFSHSICVIFHLHCRSFSCSYFVGKFPFSRNDNKMLTNRQSCVNTSRALNFHGKTKLKTNKNKNDRKSKEIAFKKQRGFRKMYTMLKKMW